MEILLGLYCCLVLPLALLFFFLVMGWFSVWQSPKRELDKTLERWKLEELEEIEKRVDALDQSSLSENEQLKILQEIMDDLKRIRPGKG